ncbi:MAG: Gfo/Idh/MocA family oxidoreductase [Phycisphaerales bacterium]|nr:Gfo/Idh/MocA family oxidoreductase [Phycisphaerales bacterium]
MPHTRRQFLTTSAGLAAAAFAPATLARARPRRSRADQINMAVVGIRSRGYEHLQSFGKLENVRIKTLCDPDERLFAERVARLEQIQGIAPGTETDLRRVLDDPEIDAISIATPDHWHALATIWACQAGKHVYVEKPCCHAIAEGRLMVKAARKWNRIVAVGFQNRSIPGVRAAMRCLHAGGIGEVYQARGLCYKPRDSIGKKADEPTPQGVHYDLWLGPAPTRPFNPNHFHYEWHWLWAYGSGDIGNQGPHQFDVARWGLGDPTHPSRVHSTGGYFKFDSDQETPNTQLATFDYPDGRQLVFEVRGLYTNDENGITIGNLFYGAEGWMHVNGGAWKTFLGRKNEPGPSSDNPGAFADEPTPAAGFDSGNPFANFIGALRANDPKLLGSEIESGYTSCVLPHLANISYRTGARALTFDAPTERFTGEGAAEANPLLARTYRDPFTIPTI